MGKMCLAVKMVTKTITIGASVLALATLVTIIVMQGGTVTKTGELVCDSEKTVFFNITANYTTSIRNPYQIDLIGSENYAVQLYKMNGTKWVLQDFTKNVTKQTYVFKLTKGTKYKFKLVCTQKTRFKVIVKVPGREEIQL
jgi:hypothetical protein